MGSSCGTPAKATDETKASTPKNVLSTNSEPTLASATRKKISKRPDPNKSPPPPAPLPQSPEKKTSKPKEIVANETKGTVVPITPSPKKQSSKSEVTPATRRPPPRAPPVAKVSTPTKHVVPAAARSTPGSPERRKIPAAPQLPASPHTAGSPREDFIGVHQCPTAPSILLQRTSSNRTAGSGNGTGTTPGSLTDVNFRQSGGYRKSAKAEEEDEEALQRVAALIRRMQQQGSAVAPSQPGKDVSPSHTSPLRIGSASSRGSRNSSASSSIGSELGGMHDAQFVSFHDSSSLLGSFGGAGSDTGKSPRLIDTPRTDLDLSVDNAIALLGNGSPQTLGRRKRSSINFSVEM